MHGRGALLRDIPRDPMLTLVLSLYLLLLAFFILLNNISEVEATRAREVTGSLQNTFATSGRPTQDPVRASSAVGNVLNEDPLEGRLEALVRSELRLATFDVIDPGYLMQLTLHEAALFWDSDSKMSGNGIDFVDRLASELARPPQGVRYGVEILFDRSRVKGGNTDEALLPRIRRAATVSQALRGKNLSHATVAAGLENARPGFVRFLFLIVAEKVTQLFEEAVGG